MGGVEHLRTAAAEFGWTVNKVFTDRPASARKGRERHPGGGVAAGSHLARRGPEGADGWPCRAGRSLTDLVALLDTCRIAGVSLWLDQEKLDTAASNGLSLFDLAGMMGHHLRQGAPEAHLGRATGCSCRLSEIWPTAGAGIQSREGQAVARGGEVQIVANHNAG